MRYGKRRFRRRYRKRSRRGRGRKLRGFALKAQRFIKNNFLQPVVYSEFNTAEVDMTTNNSYGHTGDTGWNPAYLQVGVPDALQNRLILADDNLTTTADLNQKLFVCHKEINQVEITNSGKHGIQFEMYKIKPKICFGDSLFSEYSVTAGEFSNLVIALMANDDADLSNRHFIGPEHSKKFRSYFKIIKKKVFCLDSGRRFKVKMFGKRNLYMNGSILSAATPGIGYSPRSCRFWFIRYRGLTVHDTADDGLVGTGPAHMDIIMHKKVMFYRLPDQVHMFNLNHSLDAIANDEAVLDADVAMGAAGEG